MELVHRKDLSSCLFSFVPFFLSIPFLFVYYLHRLSIYSSFSLVLFVFFIHYIVLHRFYNREVFLRAHILILILTIGCIWLSTSPAIGLFTIILAIFHLSEFISVGLWSPNTLNTSSFLLNHSPQYHAALVLAYLEYFIEKYYFFPRGFAYHWLFILVGLTMVVTGEYLRKLAMYTAQRSFTHLIQDKPNDEHRLITHGIYAHYRHPSYVGWFWWACGTQVVLANPLCFILYLIATWLFFADRVVYEETTLIRRYGELYRDYQKRVPVDNIFSVDHEYFTRHSSVVLLAFLASVGFTLLVLGCALSNYNWWPTFVIIFYVLCPIPLVIGRRCASNDSYSSSNSSSCADLMWFVTSMLVVSAFGLPVVLYRATIILPGSMAFVMAANTLVFATISMYFMTFGSDDDLLSA